MLADISDVRALDVLIDASGHESSEIRRAILFSIALIGDRSATPAVAARLDTSEDKRVRLTAVKALADLGGDAAVDALVPLLDDSDLCIDAAIALAWLGDPRAFPILVGALAEPDTRNPARTPAVALTWLGDRRAVPHLIRRLDAFADAIARSDPPDWSYLSRAESIARVLRQFGGPKADVAIERALHAFPGLNLLIPMDEEPVAPQFPTTADDESDPDRVVPKWSLELDEPSTPVVEPVTKFGGQPVWIENPTWPLTSDRTPMTFYGQVRIPDSSGRMAYLFIDPEGETNGVPLSGGNALIVQPGQSPERFLSTPIGPRYVTWEDDRTRFITRFHRRFEERRALLTPGLDPTDWDAYLLARSETEADWNKVGGNPLFLQGPEWPDSEGWTFLFQFTAAHIGTEFGDLAECYGFIRDDGGGAFLWQGH